MYWVIGALILTFGLMRIRKWWLDRQGLDQWPTPSGPYYEKWLSLPDDEGGDYYAWLAKQKDWEEPWITWGKWDK
jgi:hypothetical protein